MIFIAALLAFVIVALVALSILSRYSADPGLRSGKLQPCPASPNCVVSDDVSGKNIDPIDIQGRNPARAWESLKDALLATGGTVQKDDGTYLWATYTSPVFRFVDDVEARLDTEKQVIQLRSASRVGHSDMGANRKRVDAIIRTFNSSAD